MGLQTPLGVELDPATGQLTWKPTAEQYGRSHTISVRVQDDGTPPQSTEASFRVDVSDRAKRSADRVAAAVCLLVVETPEKDRTFPMGTACAIREDVLLTNAVVAAELQSKRVKKWQVKAFWPSDGQELPVREILVHRAFQETADAPSERIYWELAILRLEGKHDKVVPVADLQELADLEEGFPLVCAGISHSGRPRTRFDTPRVEQHQARVYLRTRLSADDSGESRGAPTLLHLDGKLPQNLYGSPLVNAEGHVVGVYAEKAKLPEADAKAGLELHYAPVVTLAHAWLAGQSLDHWTPPECRNNETPTPSGP
jgi:hypothetical protein